MKRAAAVENGIWQALKTYLFACAHIPIYAKYANFSTPRSHNEVDGTLSTVLHMNVLAHHLRQ